MNYLFLKNSAGGASGRVVWIESTQPLLEEILIATGGDGETKKKCYEAIKEQGPYEIR